MSSFAKLAAAPGLGANYSFYALPAAWVIAQAPLFWAIGAANKVRPDAYSNANPKKSWENLDKAGVSPSLQAQITRAIAAENNNHVNLPLFAAGLVAANAAHVPLKTIHALAAGYLVSRVAYNFAYIVTESEAYSWVRSGLYLSGVGSTFALFYHALNRWAVLPA